MKIFRTTLLMVSLTLLLMLVGAWWGGQGGMFLFFIISMMMNFIMYWFSDKIALKMYRAKPLSQSEAPKVYMAMEELCQRANLPMPRLYLIPTDTPNAFATGRNPKNSAVAVTQGIFRILDYEELKGVLAHELAHIGNRDTLISTLAAGIAGTIMMISSVARWGLIFGGGGRGRGGNGNPMVMLVLIIVAPIAAMMIQMAISRSREYAADASAAKFVGYPEGLVNALLKLEQGAKQIPMNANPATSHMFIVNPLTGGGIANLFSTHPPIKERVRRLKEVKI